MAHAPVHFQTQNFHFQAEWLLNLMFQAQEGLHVLGTHLSEGQTLS